MLSSSKPKQPKALWTKIADKVLINELLNQCHKGKKIDNGFKGEAWQQIMIGFNQSRPDEDPLSVKQIKNRVGLVLNSFYIY